METKQHYKKSTFKRKDKKSGILIFNVEISFMTFCNRLKRYGIDIQKDHFLLFQEMRNKAKKILCGKIEEMIELKRNKNLVFKYGDEEEFNINQIKDSDNLESPFNGQMFGSLM